MAITGHLTIIDDDQSDSQSVELDASEIDSIVKSLRACGYPTLARRIERAIAGQAAEEAEQLPSNVTIVGTP